MTNALPLQPGSLGLNLNFLTSWTSASECDRAKKDGSQPPAHFLFPFSSLSWHQPIHPQSSIHIPLPSSRDALWPLLRPKVCKTVASCAPRKTDPEKKPGKKPWKQAWPFEQGIPEPWYPELGLGAQVPVSMTPWLHGLPMGRSAAEESQSQVL